MQNNDWVLIYTSPQAHKINIAKAILEENGIDSFELNKTDSTYVILGNFELYVHQNDQILANVILEQHKL